MEIKIKNTLSNQVEIFKPIRPSRVGMYHCGPTVYSKPHLGNYRPYVFADLMRRVFEQNGYKVQQVINITDVGHLTSDSDEGEDKIEKEAKKRGQKAKQITQEIISIFFRDLKKLNVDVDKIKFPRATKYIKEQINLIKKLETAGVTYKISDGIYFDTSLFKEYGALGQIQIDELIEGARVELNPEKKNKTDFALWKFSDPKEKREQEWPSPWGVGFPGWHLECSAMSTKILGQPFDIHTGGIDHINTHHNNEIAQSKMASGLDLANYWLHVNHILFEGKKISKSLGHTLYLEDLEKENILSESYRYWVFSGHYSSLLNFKTESIKSTDTAFKKMIFYFKKIKIGKVITEEYKKVLEFLNNDFDTPQAMAHLWNLIKNPVYAIEDKKATVLEIDKILGLNIKKLIKKFERVKIPKEIVKLAEQRQNARIDKDFELSDKLREQINDLGYIIQDIDTGFEILPK